MHEITIYSVKPNAIYANPMYAEVDAALNSEIAQWYHFLKESLPKGFQAMINIKEDDVTEYGKGIKIGESGSFAKAKMETLKHFPLLALTGDHDMETLTNMIRNVAPSYDISGFSHLENPCQLTRIFSFRKSLSADKAAARGITQSRDHSVPRRHSRTIHIL